MPAETAPHSQIPMTVGSKTTRISTVDAAAFADWKKQKAGGPIAFQKIESKGLEDLALAKADSSIQKMYGEFVAAIERGELMSAADSTRKSANELYELLKNEPSLRDLRGLMTRNFAAALMDEGQQAVNNLMKMEKTEVRLYRLERIQKYAPYPRYLERAAELLGPGHYVHATLLAKKYYFEGQVLQLKSPLNPDSVLAEQVFGLYKKSLSWQPEFPLAYYQMSKVFQTVRPDKDSALVYADKAIGLAPAWTLAINQTAIYLIQKKDYPAARKRYGLSLSINPASAETWTALAVYHFQTKQLDSMEHCLRKSLSLDATYSPTWYWLGILEFNGRYNKANSEQYFLKAAQADKPSPDVFMYLGAIHSNKRDNPVAEKYYKMGLEIDPGNTLCGVFLSDIYFETDRPDEAKALIEKALAYDSSSTQIFNLGIVYYKNHFYAEAARVFRRVIQINPAYTYAYHWLAQVYYASNQIQEAESMLVKCIQLDSANVYRYNMLADFYARTNRFAEADSLYQKVLKLAPTNSWHWGQAGVMKLFHQKDPAAALGFFRHALDLNKKEAFYYDFLAFAHAKMGQFDRVVQVTNEWLAVDSLSLRAHLRKGRAYQKLGKKAEAQALFQKLLTGSPTEMDGDSAYYFRIIGQIMTGQTDTLDAYIESERLKSDNPDYFYQTTACAFACAGQAQQAVYWLGKKKHLGHFAWELLEDTDLALIEDTPEFRALLKKHFPEQLKD